MQIYCNTIYPTIESTSSSFIPLNRLHGFNSGPLVLYLMCATEYISHVKNNMEKEVY